MRRMTMLSVLVAITAMFAVTSLISAAGAQNVKTYKHGGPITPAPGPTSY